MPNCPECGLDVPEEGLCHECREAKQRRTGQAANPRTFRLLLVVLVVAAAFAGGLLLGRGLPFGAAQVPDRAAADSVGGPERTKVASLPSPSINQSDTEGTTVETAAEKQESGLVPVYDINGRQEHPPIEDSQENAFVAWMRERTGEEEEFLRKRWLRSRACKTLYATPDLSEPRVIEAFLRTPRHIFARDFNARRAYDNAALPIGWGQTISGPHMVGRMSDVLNPQPHHRVLEVGTGSGYQSAVFSELSNFVFTIEIVEPLAGQTDELYSLMESDYPQYKNIKRKVGDGYYGWKDYAPFDRIAVTAGIDHIPPSLLKQLALDGIMLIPIGPPSGQTLLKITKSIDDHGNTVLTREDVYKGTKRGTIIFVPFTEKDDAGKLKERWNR